MIKNSAKNYPIIITTYLTATLAFVFLYFFFYCVSGKLPRGESRIVFYLQMLACGLFSGSMYYSIYLLHKKNPWGIKLPLLTVALLAVWMMDIPALLGLPVVYFFLSRHQKIKEYFGKE